ncbi:cobyrinic acid a,c-diamide synthase [filamentous cyanobacterium Phorm 6]|nr:cobyrinic acid a,c-diamide synthase [filamentous cyanobacterium Phorm 6]
MAAIVAFVNQKGGCAKSTTAVHFAHWLVQQDKSVLVVDADAQRSSSQWCSKMEPAIATHVLQSPDDLLDQLTDLAATVDYLVVDGPAGLSEATRAILMRADLAVVPVQPSGIDVQSAADAVRLIKQAQSVRQGPPQAVMFLSRAVKGTKLKTEAMELLGKLTPTIKVLKSVIHQKQVIADSSGQSATVWDLGGQPAKDSGKEYSRLFKEIMGALK